MEKAREFVEHGYGYKTAQSAQKAAAYKFKRGKKKQDAAKAFWRKYKDFAQKLSEALLASFKDPPTNAELIAFAAECGVINFDLKLV